MNNTLTEAIKFNWMARLKSNQLKKKKTTTKLQVDPNSANT